MDLLSNEYLAAIFFHNKACRAYQAALEDYRAMKTDDETFLAARADYVAATDAFDVAFNEEGSRTA